MPKLQSFLLPNLVYRILMSSQPELAKFLHKGGFKAETNEAKRHLNWNNS